MRKRIIAPIGAILLAAICIGLIAVVINTNQLSTPATLADSVELDDEAVVEQRNTVRDTPRISYNERDVYEPLHTVEYYISGDGTVIHASQRVMDVAHVEVLFDNDLLEYIPGTFDQWFSAMVNVTYADNVQEIHGISDSVTWSSSNDQVIEVWQGGNIFVVGEGIARIVAEYRGVVGEKEVTVVRGEIERIVLLPEELVLIQSGVSESRNISYMPNLSVIAYTSRGNRFGFLNESNVISVRSHNPEIVTASELMQDSVTFEGSGHMVLSGSHTADRSIRQAGETYIEVTLLESMARGGAEAFSARVPVIALSADNIIDIELWHYGDTLAQGISSGITAHAIFDCGRRFDIFRYAEWTVDAPEIIEVNDFGMITALNLGEATITATYAGLSSRIIIQVVEETANYVDRIPFP